MTSRTILIAQWGMAALGLLSVELLVALWMGVKGDDLAAIAEVVGTLAMAVSALCTGSAVGHSARHWGAKEPSGKRVTDGY